MVVRSSVRNDLSARVREGSLTVAFFAALAILWIAILVPAMLRAHANRPLSSAERFRRRMDLLAPPSPRAGRWVCVLDSPDRKARSTMTRAHKLAKSRRRRRRVLVFLLLLAGGSAAYAIVSGGVAWEAHAGIDAALALYVGFLIETGRRRIERSAKIRPLGLQRSRAGAARGLRRAPATEDFGFYEPIAAGDRRS